MAPEQPVSPFSLAWRTGKVVTLVLLFLAGFCYAAYLHSSSKAEQLDRLGVTTEGTVVAANRETIYRDGERHFVDRTIFTFTTEEGSEAKDTIIGRPYKATGGGNRNQPRYKAGQKLTVRYLPENPKVYELGEGSSRRKSSGALTLANLFMGLAFLACLYYFGSSLRLVRIRDRGKAKKVKVCEAPPKSNKYERQNIIFWKLDKDTIGKSLPVKSGSPKPAPGSSITVYVAGEKSCWQGDVGPSKAKD